MMPTHPCRALVATFDEFPASILGCYGNEWIETPHLDRLAAEGTAADQCWAARIGAATAEEAFSAATCLAALHSQSVGGVLIQEAGSQIDFSRAGFDAVRAVTGEQGPSAMPDRIALAEAVRAAKELRRNWAAENSSGLVWIHCRGLPIPAQPPAGFAELYRDEFEDRGVVFDEMSAADRQRHPATAAGMASLLDHWLGEFFALAGQDDAANHPTLIIMTATQGSPWQPLPDSFGELDELRSQTAQVPFVVGGQVAVPAGLRIGSLLSTQDLGPILEWWFRDHDRQSTWRELLDQFAASHADGVVTRRAAGGSRISTPDWAAVFPAEQTAADSSEAKPLLFRKPEDYWEVNNLAEIEPDVIRKLSERGA